jgi:hemerythrin-like domain-containing protein
VKTLIQSQLSNDHRNLAWLLKVMDRETQHVEQVKPTNFELLRDIMHYMTVYPDEVHHRLEDILYRSLLEREPQAASVLERMFEEHVELAQLGSAFLHTLELVVAGDIVEREAIVSAAQKYTSTLRAHLVYENESVFPLADDSLKAADWHAIADQFARQRDPVFGPVKDADFADLLACIERDNAGA